MEKNTKNILAVAILGVGGYMLYKSMKPTPPAAAQFIGDRKKTREKDSGKKRMVGYTGNIFGKRMMSGKKNLTELNTDVVRDSGWLRATGLAQGNTNKFFDVNNSGWLR